MTERHQLVLQVLMARGALTEANFDSLLLDASRQLNLPLPQGGVADRCKNFATEVNASLSFASLEVRRAMSENSEEAYWGIVNTKADAIAQIATKYTFVELNMFKKTIDLIVLAPATPSEPRKPPKKRGKVHLNRILMERGGTFTIPQLQRLLDRLVEDMWLWQVRPL